MSPRGGMGLLGGLVLLAIASGPGIARAQLCNQDLALCGPGETPTACPSDCGDCGDLRCDPHESAAGCPEDCGPCGNLRCEPGEPGSCPSDCDLSICGDLVCDAAETDCAIDCGVAVCANGLDDDGDGLADGADPGCADPGDTDEHSPTLPCDDGVDGDGDGAADFPADPGCQTATSPIENPKCQDGLDNDGDTGIDFDGGRSLDLDQDGFVDRVFNPSTPATGTRDPQCANAPWKGKEGSSCGVGAELALVFSALQAARRSSRRG